MQGYNWLDLSGSSFLFSTALSSGPMRHHPGEVWFLPPESEEGGDPKGRRHVLLTPCDHSDDICVLAYASTQSTEARFGAGFLLVDPATSGSSRCGFTRPSYVYPSRLVPATSENLQRMTGRLVEEMTQLRLVLREALGIGTGAAPDEESSSWRGRVVRLSRSRREAIGYGYAIVVTEPRYSSRQRYQTVVPIEDLREFEPGPGDVEVTRGDWFRSVSSETGVLVAVPDVQSVFHSRDIDGWTGALVDDTTMERVDRALIELFDL
jgi:hypothetical protein